MAHCAVKVCQAVKRSTGEQLEWAFSDECQDVMQAPRAAALHDAGCVAADAFCCEACGAAALLVESDERPAFVMLESHAEDCTEQDRGGAMRAYVARFRNEP